MTGTENSRWVAVSALGAAMFALGFSFSAVACNNTPDVSVSEAARAADSVSVPAPAASLGSVTKILNGVACRSRLSRPLRLPPLPARKSKLPARA